ncbi:TonB-dependent receptor [Brevundimonas sp.]|jgi:outer membrane receptor protein involved in Fe transport|uniref:TonB-dependent receptor n=1 Tax=Brevundimonas sp. TaxID=1871086 RepID=UPI002E15D27D|nr:TonB-dependent receptor [Brevundimonas sp.]
MRLNHILRTTVSAAVVGTAVFGAAGVAAAQEQEVTRVDDIIVTAQKREQSLQDVPIVVTTLSQEMLEDAGVRDIKDLQILTPGMTVTSTASEASTTARIRGVGTVGDNPGLESSVGVVIDGVYRSRNSVGFGDLGELQRIEVLKGPQGTLFGKNTSAGVINIITEQPSFTPEFNFEATVGNYDAKAISGSVSGPLTDALAFRLYAGRRLRDGFMTIDTGDGPRPETDDNNQDFGTVRGQLLWLPTDGISMRFIADYSKRDEYCCVGTQVRTGPTYPFIDGTSTGTGQRPPAPGFGALPFSRTAFANRSTGQEVEDKGFSLETNIDFPSLFGGATLTSITSVRDWSFVNGQDADFTGADIAYRLKDGDFGFSVENATQEFRLAGATDRLDWLVGVFATREDIERRDSFYLGADYAPVLSFQISAALNAAVPAFPVSPSIIPCFTRTAQTSVGLQSCLGTGGAVFGGGPAFAAGQSLEDVYLQRSDSFAVFTNNTFSVTDQLDITLGLRYTYDDKGLEGRQRNGTGAAAATCAAGLGNQAAIAGLLGASTTSSILGRLCLPWSNPFYNNRAVNEAESDGEVSGTIKASYRISPEAMVYGSYARGYKSFGYNLDRVQTGITPNASLLFPSEVVDSYELGAKLTLLDRTVLLNVTYFDQTFTDFQLNTFLGTSFVVESIPELTSRGVDADFVWFTPVEGLSFSGGVTYTETQYGEFVAADLANPGNFPQLSLLPGATASFAPEWSGSASVNFDRSLGGGLRGGFSLSAKYMSEYNTGSDLIPFKDQEAFTMLNGRVSIGTEDERWTLEGWVQNLTDEEYIQVAYNAFLQGSAFQSTVQPNGTFYNPALDSQTYNAFNGAPRTYGMTLRYRY